MPDPLLNTPYARDISNILGAPYTTHGESVRLPKSGGTYYDPINVFMLYVSEDSSRHFVAKHLVDYYIDNSKIDAIEVEMFMEARGSKPTPRYVGDGFDGMHWRFPCYFVVALDIDRWKFNWGTTVGDDPLIFREYKINGSGPFAKNFSFYNASIRNLTYTDSQGQTRHYALLRCINYLKDEQGYDLDEPRKKRFYAMDICVIDRILTSTSVPIGIDPDGQNQGPPQ